MISNDTTSANTTVLNCICLRTYWSAFTSFVRSFLSMNMYPKLLNNNVQNNKIKPKQITQSDKTTKLSPQTVFLVPPDNG